MLNQIENLMSILVGFLGLVLVILIITSYKSNKLVNAYLIIVFTLASARHIHKGLLGFFYLNIIEDQLYYLKPIFLIGIPAFYLYFKSLFEDVLHFNLKHLKHFIFPIILIATNIIQKLIENLNILFIELLQTGSILIFLIVYSVKVLMLIYKNLFSKNKKILYSEYKHYALIKNWTLFFSSAAILLSVRVIYAICYETNNGNDIIAYSFSFISSSIWLLIFMKILFNPEILFGYPKLKEKLIKFEEANTAISTVWNETEVEINNQQDYKLKNTLNENKKKYIIEIDTFINSNNPFRNPKYSVKDLSIDLNIPSSHLAYIFKYHCKMPFVEYKNYIRVNDALNLIDNDFLETKTLEALSDKIGFITYNSFFTAFKKYKGVAPKEFLSKK